MSATFSPSVDVLPELGLRVGHWTVDQPHSSVLFSIRHLGLAKVRGRFELFSATLDVGSTLAETRIGAEIDLASIDTNNADRDAHLRSTDFFDTATHPTMTYVSMEIRTTRDGFAMIGDLTLNGITRQVPLAVEFNGTEIFAPTGKLHVGFSATGAIKRSEFGIEFGLAVIGTDKLALGDEVKIEIELEFVEPDAI